MAFSKGTVHTQDMGVGFSRVIQSLLNIWNTEYYKNYSVNFTLMMKSWGWQETVKLPGSEAHREMRAQGNASPHRLVCQSAIPSKGVQ